MELGGGIIVGFWFGDGVGWGIIVGFLVGVFFLATTMKSPRVVFCCGVWSWMLWRV